MPRGNDSAAAVAELADEFAVGQVRAEDLTTANRRRFPSALREAQLKERDEAKSAEVDWAKAAKAAGVEEEDVLDVAVRGDQVVVAFEDRRGDTQKVCVDADEVGVEVRRSGAQRRAREAAAAREAEEAEEREASSGQADPPKGASKSASKKRSRSKSKKSS